MMSLKSVCSREVAQIRHFLVIHFDVAPKSPSAATSGPTGKMLVVIPQPVIYWPYSHHFRPRCLAHPDSLQVTRKRMPAATAAGSPQPDLPQPPGSSAAWQHCAHYLLD